MANSYRALEEMGWQHAEPVLRSLAYALLMHEGSNPAQRDAEYDRHGRENEKRIAEIRPDWLDGQPDQGATTELLSTLRTGTPEEASRLVVEMLNRGVAPQSLWDALFCSSAEMLVKEPGIPAIHNVTFTNAVYFAWLTSRNPQTRQFALLQNAAFIPWMRRERFRLNGTHAKFHITELKGKSPGDTIANPARIFEQVSSNKMQAAQQVLAYLEAGESPAALFEQARMLIFLKGRDSHDYKFSSAVLEDYYHISPEWRNRFLASSVFNLSGIGDRDNPLVERTRAALG